MAEPIIESEFDTMHMGPPLDGTFPATEINPNATRYWGNIPERRYVLPFWAADRLLADSPTGEIALKVRNIGNPALLEAEWVSFSSNDPVGEVDTDESGGGFIQWLIDLLKSLQSPPPEETVNYYVIGSSLYAVSGNLNFRQFTPHSRMTIVARIGETPGGRIIVYFNVCELVQKGDGPGGPGTSSGAKIPSGDDDE